MLNGYIRYIDNWLAWSATRAWAFVLRLKTSRRAMTSYWLPSTCVGHVTTSRRPSWMNCTTVWPPPGQHCCFCQQSATTWHTSGQ